MVARKRKLVSTPVEETPIVEGQQAVSVDPDNMEPITQMNQPFLTRMALTFLGTLTPEMAANHFMLFTEEDTEGDTDFYKGMKKEALKCMEKIRDQQVLTETELLGIAMMIAINELAGTPGSILNK